MLTDLVRYDPVWVREFYDDYGMREWERWDASPVERIKFAVHRHHLRQCVQAGWRVLEIGAGPGRFTAELAVLGARGVVADLSPRQLQLDRRQAEHLGFAPAVEAWVECDLCDLAPHFEEAQFDAVVAYGGPLSYALDARRKGLEELRRVARPGAPLLLSVMSLWGTIHHRLPGVLVLSADTNRAIIACGDLDPEHLGGGHRAHLFRGAELRAFLEEGGLQVRVISASDCLSANWGDALSTVAEDPERWAHLLEMEIEACVQPGCVDMGTHLIAVAS